MKAKIEKKIHRNKICQYLIESRALKPQKRVKSVHKQAINRLDMLVAIY